MTVQKALRLTKNVAKHFALQENRLGVGSAFRIVVPGLQSKDDKAAWSAMSTRV